MLKKIVFGLFLISFAINAQISIKGELKPANDAVTWVVLYQLKGAKQLYIANSKIVNAKFQIDFPENAEKGMYRLLYTVDNTGYLDFIYDGKNIELTFDPKSAFKTADFTTSDINKTFHEYNLQSAIANQKLDSLQLSYLKDSSQKGNEKFYVKALAIKDSIQAKFEQKSKGTLAYAFIKASNKYYAPTLIKTAQDYLNSEKTHFFDYINFSNEQLINSTVLNEKVIDYVFYLNQSDDIQVQNALYVNAVKEVMGKGADNQSLKSQLLTSLMYIFAQKENTLLVDYIFDNYYIKLPKLLQNEDDIKQIQTKVKMAIGKIAPDFSWEENGSIKKLYDLKDAEVYIVIFWSTTCSHCLHEIPEVYEYLKSKKQVHVVGVVIDKDDEGFKKYKEIYSLWTNVYGAGKWENEIAQNYQVVATPTYIILDKNKKIIAKPEHYEDLKKYFESQK